MSLNKHMFWKHKIELNFLLTLLKKVIYNKENNKILKPIKNNK